MEDNKRHGVYWRMIAVASALSLLMLIVSTFASEGFEIYPDKESYYPNQDIFIIVSGPPATSFSIQILDPFGKVVSERRGETTASGNAYLTYDGFSSEGTYVVRLLSSSSVKASSSFSVARPTIVSTTTKVVTTVTVTTSFVYPTTPTTSTVVTTTGEGWGSSPAGTAPPSDSSGSVTTTTLDYGSLPAIVKRVDFGGGNVLVENSGYVKSCSGGTCTLRIGSPEAQMVASDGSRRAFTDVVAFGWTGSGFALSWPGRSGRIMPFVVYNGTRYSLDELNVLFPALAVDAVVRDNSESYKYALNLSNIDPMLASELEYVGFELSDFSGELRKAGATKIVVDDQLALGFDDLIRSNFTVTIVNESIVLVGNVSNKTTLLLDPTIQLQTAGTQNLRDTWVWSNAADTNYGTDSTMSLQDRVTRRGRMYVMFNISAVPSSVAVSDAQLCLYLSNNGNTVRGSAYHVMDHTWDGQSETTITWNNQVCGTGFDDAGDCNLTAESTQAALNAVGWYCWNVTKMFKVEYNSGDKNLSIVIKSPETAGLTADEFCTKEGSAGACTAARRPYLNVTYTDSQAPKYSNIQQSPSGNPIYGYAVQCNATWTDNVALSRVLFRSNFSGSWQNYTPSSSGSVYYYSIPSAQLSGGEKVGWNFWANDTSSNWNKSMPTQSFTVQKASTTMTLYLNGTNGDRTYAQNDLANFTAVLSVAGKTIEIWTNLSGSMQLHASGLSPLQNLTVLSHGLGKYLIKANFSGDQNYTASAANHTLTILPDASPPTISGVSPINQTVGLGSLVVISANVIDNIRVDTVLLNITPPSGSPQIYKMTNSSPDLFSYSFRVWATGDYYYKIIANDSYGNKREYDPYIYVRGAAVLGVSTESSIYGLNEDVKLSSLSSWSSSDIESGIVTKRGKTTPVLSNITGLLVYGVDATNTPMYRIWNRTSSSWSSVTQANNIGNEPEFISVACTQAREECALLTTDTTEDVNFQLYSRINDVLCWNNGTVCNQVREFETNTPALNGVRQADMAYENSGRDLLIVWAGDANSEIEYRIWNGTGYSAEGSFTFTATIGTIEWIDVEREPGTDNLAVAVAGSDNEGAIVVWNGSSNSFISGCQHGPVSGLSASERQKVDCAFEQLSGDLFCAFGISSTSEFIYVTKPFNSCTFSQTQTTDQDDESDFVHVASRGGANTIVIVHIDDSGNDMEAVAWNGTALSSTRTRDTGVTAEQNGDHRAALACIPGANTCKLIYGDNQPGGGLDQRTYTPSTDSWDSTADWTPNPVFSDEEEAILCYPYPDDDKIMCVIEDNADDLWAKTYDASANTWSNTEGGAALDSTTSIPGVINFDFDWIKAISSEYDEDDATDYTTYNNVLSTGIDNLIAVGVTVYVSYYNTLGSDRNSNNAPDLQLELYDGSSWVIVGNFSVDSTGNFTLYSSDSSVLSAWSTAANSDLRIRGINFDYYNYSTTDEIRWTGVWVRVYNGSALLNTGETNISGYLLMTVEENSSGSWVLVDTIINDTKTSTLRNITAGSYLNIASLWNAAHWNTDSEPSGHYRAYVALLSANGSVLVGDDGNPMEGFDVFELTVYGKINATPQTTGYGQKVTISAEVLDPTTDDVFVYIARPGEAYTQYTMTKASGSIYKYNFTNTWKWGNYSYYIWSNNSLGYVAISDPQKFYVRANVSLTVKTENDTYGPNEDVNLAASEMPWWNTAYRYRKQLTITNMNNTLVMESGYSVKLVLDTQTLISAGKMQADCDDLRVVWYNTSSSTWVELNRVNETACNSASTEIWFPTKTNISGGGVDTNYYIYYGNPTAANPPANRSIIYLWWDDFSTNTLSKYSQAKWVDIHGGAAQYTPPVYDAVNKRVTFDTGDNIASDMYPIGVTARDLLMEVDLFVTGSYPLNATIALVGRLENPGAASTHYYFDYSAQSTYPSPGITVDSWITGERSNTVYQANPYYYFSWKVVNKLKYAIYGTTHKVWINDNITNDADIVATDSTHTNAGSFGLAPAQAIGWWDNYRVRRFVGTDPQVTAGSEEDRLLSRAYNFGSTNVSGYLEMRVQRYSAGSWVNFEPPFVNDRLPPQNERTINSGSVLMLDSIWNPRGWNTSLNTPGTYRAYVRFLSPSGSVLVNDNGSSIEGWYVFTILSSYMKLTSIEHENNYTVGINEYETGDNIAWINVTVINRNTTSVNASITLDVVDKSGNSISWGPQSETKYCGNLLVNQTCEKRFDNNTYGYFVPLDATAGGYTFYWNVTMGSLSGIRTYNNSLYFRVHHIPNNLTSSLSPTKIFQNRSAVYNFTLTNPWSRNLTNVAVAINCPAVAGMVCSCSGTGLPYCVLSSLSGGSSYTFSFNITTNNTPPGDYLINATLNYTNPGLEEHTWIQQQPRVLRIRIPGQFVVISSYPSNITRGSYGNLSGYSNNTLGSPMHNVTLTWTILYGWSNSSGRLTVFEDIQDADELIWNNVTVYVNTSSSLGPQMVELRSDSAEGYEDWDDVWVTIYARTKIISLQSNNTGPSRGDVIRLSGRLLLDNGKALSSRTVSLYDATDSVAIGSGLTNSLGWFYVDYTIPSTASIGDHIIYANFSGLLTAYYLKSYNTTTISVHDKPTITGVSDSPDPQGYGYNVTIRANVTDLEGVDVVRVCITPPSSSQTCYLMTNISSNIYEYNFTNTWKWGNYSYYVWANDTVGKISTSSTYIFHIGANAVLNIKTIKGAYIPNEDVNLTSAGAWWNYSWDYRRRINVTERNNTQLTDYVVNITINTQSLISAGKMQADCDDIRVVQGTTVLNYSVRGSTCNTASTVIEFEVDLAANSYADNIYIYYGNPYAANAESVVGYNDDANTVFLYHFTEGSGTNVYDFSGDGNNGTLINGPTWSTTARFGDYSIRLPGTNEYIREGTSMSVLASGTLELWFRLDEKFNSSSLYSQGIFGIWSAANNHMYVSLCGRDRTDANCPQGGLMFKTESPGTGVDYCASNKVDWNANEWYHLAVTWNGATRNIYINGVLDRSCSDNGRTNFAGYNLFIGAAQIEEITGTPVKYLKGFVDEVRGSNSVRSPLNFLVRVNEPSASFVGSEETPADESFLYNDYTVGLKGYLLMRVQRYVGGTWVNVSSNNPVVSDSTPRSISPYNYLNLNSIWNGLGEGDGWNTDKEPLGLYRVYVALRSPSGAVLRNDDGSYIYDTYNFNITHPPAIVQLQQIRIYDVTNAINKKTDTSYLMGSGLNTTFTLFTNKTYRVEVVVWNNDTSTSPWYVSSSDVIYHEGLDSTWAVNALEDIWYANSSHNFSGGVWSSGRIMWNTSLNGTLPVDGNIVFYYIFNITSNNSDNYPVHFLLNDTMFTLEDYSTYSVVLSEDEPPKIYGGLYDVTRDIIHRNESLVVYARWNEAISQALAEYNTTTSSLVNHTITLPTPNPYYWTNHTISPNSSWLLGYHGVKIYAADLNGNWNNTLWYLPFEVWGWASVTDSSLNPETIVNGSSTTIRCRVTSDNGLPLSNYNVSFYNSTNLLGVNQTNALGWASWTFQDYSLGYETIKCNITDYPEVYYSASSSNYRTHILRTIETKPPWYINVSENATKVHRGEKISFSAYWYDNVWLKYALLSSNNTGTWLNNSLASRLLLNASEKLAQFNVTIPTNSRLGVMGWRIWANDTSSNWNKTNVLNYTVWGYAVISSSSLSPNPIYVNETSTMRCRVVDYNNGSAISNYNVSFYSNESGYLGSNLTNSSGWASWTYNDSTVGWETLTCNISSYAARYYDPRSPNSASQNLRAAAPGEDTDPPGALIYGINDTILIKGERLKVYAKWDENISAAQVTYNSTSSSLRVYNVETISGYWTNHTIVTNSSWVVGVHYVKLNASDRWSNWNNTLNYLTFSVYGRSKVAWYSPTSNTTRGIVPISCRVYDKDNNQGIGNYPVDFYDSSWNYLDTIDTNSSGIATYEWNATGVSPGQKTFYCRISDSGYYMTNPADDDASGTFNLVGILSTTIDYPLNKSVYHKTETVRLNSTTRDEYNTVVVPDTARWYDGATQIASGEDTSWVIPASHNVGPMNLNLSVSKQYYVSDDSRVTIYVWGYSNVSWVSPVVGNFSVGATIPLVCRVMDVNSSSGVGNYPVRFYYKNSTEATYHYIGVSLTNSTGYAVRGWDTVGLSAGNYTTKCNITHNATLYYNRTSVYTASKNIILSTAGGRLEVYLMLPPTIPGDGEAQLNSGYKVGQNKTFIIRANVTCRNSACGNVQGSVRYNLSSNPDTLIPTAYNTPFYVVSVPAQNPKSCAGNPLDANESCVLNWTINSTGALGSRWKIDVLFEGSSALGNDTNDTTIHITKVLIMHLSADDIDWGIKDPQTTCNPAPNNPVNISLDLNSNDADGVYIRGEDLVNGTYSIGVGNITWGKVNICTNGYRMNSSWSQIRGFTAAGTSQQTYYWINIPAVPALRYHGYAYVMANASTTG